MDSSQFSEWGYRIVQTLGYPGLFFVNLVSCSSIFFPLPGYILVFIFGGILNPFLVAIFAALGATFGGLTAYGLGRGGGYVLKQKQKKYFEMGKEWFKKGRGFLVIILFAATPLPYDLIGILAGIFNYHLKKFILATFLGKMIMHSVLAFGGFYGINWLLNIFQFSF